MAFLRGTNCQTGDESSARDKRGCKGRTGQSDRGGEGRTIHDEKRSKEGKEWCLELNG